MKPRIIIHNALSIDGKLTGFMPDLGTYYSLAGHWGEQAALVGSETILAAMRMDGVQNYNSVGEGPADPPPPEERAGTWFVAIDGRCRILNWRHWASQPYWRGVIVLTSQIAPREYINTVTESGAICRPLGIENVDLSASFDMLNTEFGIDTIRVDSGGSLNAALLAQGLVDEISLLIHPALAAGTDAVGLIAPETEMPIFPALRLLHVERMGADLIWLRYGMG